MRTFMAVIAALVGPAAVAPASAGRAHSAAVSGGWSITSGRGR